MIPRAPLDAARIGRRLLLTAPLLAAPGLARAQSARTLRIVVPFAAGSEPDILGRRLAHAMAPILDQPVVVDNRIGGNTVIAASHVAQSRPDGETLLLTSSSTFATLPNLHANPPVRLDQFEVMTMAMRAHMVLYTSADVPAATIPELIAWANAQPEPIHYGANRGAIGHLCGEKMKRVTGIRMTDVSFRGSLVLQQLMLRGDIKLAFDGVPAHAELVNAGRLKAFGITADRPAPMLPNVRPLAEQGFGDIALSYWYGIFAPKGTPGAILERQIAAIHRAQRAEELLRQFSAQGAQLEGNSPAEFRRMIDAERESWGEIIRAIGLTLD
ncbi:tripartite tricarboxylate transporter substrate binding protein [Roseomonas stagni]|uniref:Tripartite tricarboxylate transporter substrate binding protein n=1 Tax=Falsiroseomonas algicola TaxID=2716930 RepID=A0A6M1LU57_9PROT|nr:tripartite tricarboxylate transporter substrate binding protein [Falsiroseomonas algicola]NGM23522.1 tripartite tricarboxylate transporter substrate binding protein [Falsiroseomonas algicola]